MEYCSTKGRGGLSTHGGIGCTMLGGKGQAEWAAYYVIPTVCNSEEDKAMRMVRSVARACREGTNRLGTEDLGQ